MEKTASEIYGPVMELIKKMQNASPNEKNCIEKELFVLAEKTRLEFLSFDQEFSNILNTNIELEEKLKNLNVILDKKMDEISYLDMEDSKIMCKEMYKDYWDKLNPNSQNYLAMANYLYKLFTKDNKDFSPSVLEFGRALENELIQKIYSGYVTTLINNTTKLTDRGNRYKILKNSIKTCKKYNSDCHIPARSMIRYLSFLSNADIKNAYNDALKQYLYAQKINYQLISESDFTNVADEIFRNYRNPAAHPNTTMTSKDAKECEEKTKVVLSTFMNAL